MSIGRSLPVDTGPANERQVISYEPLKALAGGNSDIEGIMKNKTEDYWGRRAAIHLLKDNN